MVGQTLSHFRILAKVGEGGMGVVYRALDTRLDRSVAIKVLPPEKMADPDRRRRFLREAKTEASLTHPNIAAVHDVDEAGGIVFIAMEYVEGQSLRSLMSGRALPVNEAVRIAREIAEALAWAHAHRVIHRDLKPDNIMVRPDGHVKILDFGLARLLQDPSDPPPTLISQASTLTGDLTLEGQIAGTAPYMSPEQACGGSLDPRSDLFSFGVLLYEMVTGRRPFEGASLAETIRAIVGQPHPPAASHRPGLPPAIEEILERCLRKDPQARYPAAEDLKADLDRAVSVMPPAAGPPKASGARSMHIVAAGAAVLLALMAILLVPPLLKDRFRGGPGDARQAIKRLAVLPFENPGGNQDVAYLSDGLADTLINNLSQLSKLHVMARYTVSQYRGQDPRKVGRELAVGAVLTGRVLQRGEDLVIRAELVDADTGSRLWGSQYDRRTSDILGVEEDVAREIARELLQDLTGDEQRRLSKRHTGNPAAYRLYLRGRGHLTLERSDEAPTALKYFNDAARLDPGFALAYAGIADAYYLMSNVLLPPREAMPKARAAALKALELDGDLAEAHTTLAVIEHVYEWDWNAAGEAYRRALELNPGYAPAHQFYGYYLMNIGRTEDAIREIGQARALDPVRPLVAVMSAWPFYNALPGRRRYERAAEEIRKVILVDPDYYPAHMFLGQVALELGRFDEAILEMEKARDILQDSVLNYLRPMLGYIHARTGSAAEARRMLNEITAAGDQGMAPASYIAEIYAALGEKDHAFEWLEKALGDRDEELVFLKVNPRLDPLRSDPRFQRLLERVGLAS